LRRLPKENEKIQMCNPTVPVLNLNSTGAREGGPRKMSSLLWMTGQRNTASIGLLKQRRSIHPTMYSLINTFLAFLLVNEATGFHVLPDVRVLTALFDSPTYPAEFKRAVECANKYGECQVDELMQLADGT
jgi:hypothetical protein